MEFKPELKNILAEDDTELKDTEKNSVGSCQNCNAGYTQDGKICNCLKETIMKRKYENANINYEFASIPIIDKEMDAFLKNGDEKIKINMNNFINQYVNNANENLKNGFGFLLNGGTGRGKSLSAMKTLMFLSDKGYKCYFITVKQFLEIIKKSWEDEDYKKLLNYIYNCDFLTFDDLGVELHKTDWTLVEIDSLFRYRYFKKKSTIITTNSSLSNLREKYAQRIISLFHERLMFIAVVTKEDFREKKAKVPSYINLEELKNE
jgi:DNA replication protein DnaC